MKKLFIILLMAGLLLSVSACTDIASQLTTRSQGELSREKEEGPSATPLPAQEAAPAAGENGGNGAAAANGEITANGEPAPEAKPRPLALICGPQGVEDQAAANDYDWAAWQGLLQYSQASGLAAQAYPAAQEDQASRLAAVGLAVEGGAQLIVAAGQAYEDTVYEAQYLYPHIGFILIDGEPHSLDFSQYAIAANTFAVSYTEQELGYLAGYALVSEGCTKLGFIGALATADMVRCGAGFIQGAAQAATDSQTQVTVSYCYSGLLGEDQRLQNLAGSWYANGVEAIFAAGNFTASVCGAAEAAAAYVLAMNTDQYDLSSSVVSSAVKNISLSVYNGAEDWFDGSFWGGKRVTQGLGSQGVGLAMEHERFNNFSAANLRMLLNRFDNDELQVTPVTTAGFDLTTLCGEYLTLSLE